MSPLSNVEKTKIFYPSSYGAAGNGVTDDTTALQACINAAQAAYGEMYIPRGQYLISAPLVISSTLTMTGAGAHDNYGPIANITPYKTYTPYVAPFLTGSVIVQSGSAMDALQVTTVGQSVSLRNFGITFANQFVNTGHGVNCNPPLVSGQTYQDNGIMGAEWSSIKVWGHDGNHYGFVFNNMSWCNFNNLRSYGGGHLLITNNSQIDEYGNAVFTAGYGSMPCGGTAHGIYLQNISAGALSAPNLVTFVRQQMTAIAPSPAIPGTTSITSAQYLIKADPNAASCGFFAPDLESSVCPLQFSGSAFNGRSAWTNGGTFTNFPGVTTSPTSGTIYQNLAGTGFLWVGSITMNPTSSAAASLVIALSANSNMSSSFTAAQISIPANGPAGGIQQITFLWTCGYYATFTYANCTITTVRSINTL